MNVQIRERPEPASSGSAKTAIADGDIHPARATKTERLRGSCASRTCK